MAIENGLVTPKTPGVLRLDTPAGMVVAEYRQDGEYVEEVRITNVPSFLHAEGLTVECPGSARSRSTSPMAAISTPSSSRRRTIRDMADHSAGDLIAWSPVVRQRLNEKYSFVHPENPGINRLSHMLWTGKPTHRRGRCPQRRLLRRQGDRPLALRHRHLGAHGAASRQGQAEGRRRFRPRIDHRLAVQGPGREARPSVAGQAGDHSLDRRLGAA